MPTCATRSTAILARGAAPRLALRHAIEVGHVFKLGTKYTDALNAKFLDADEQLKPIIMGCYGIGVNRIIAGLIETSNDKDGIIWPVALAPYEVVLTLVKVPDEPSMKVARQLHDQLAAAGIDVLLDDRDCRAGVKFKDADLIGVPLRVVIGERPERGQAGDQVALGQGGREDRSGRRRGDAGRVDPHGTPRGEAVWKPIGGSLCPYIFDAVQSRNSRNRWCGKRSPLGSVIWPIAFTMLQVLEACIVRNGTSTPFGVHEWITTRSSCDAKGCCIRSKDAVVTFTFAGDRGIWISTDSISGT